MNLIGEGRRALFYREKAYVQKDLAASTAPDPRVPL